VPSCITRFSRTLTSPRRRAFLLVFALACVTPALRYDTAGAQSFRPLLPLEIDLYEVGRYYDTLHRDRVTGDITGEVRAFDWKYITLGNERYKIKHFLGTNVDSTRTVVDYSVIPGYRTVFTVPITHFFETTEQEVGDLTITNPRDFSLPEITADIDSMGDVVREIQHNSREQLWKDYARSNVTSLPIETGSQQTGGIRFDIPLPMPKGLESIFGPGDKTSITIRGREEITLAGQTTVVKPFIGAEGRESQSLFPSLDMQQKLDVSLIGTIGDKVSIQVDHSSEAIGDDANRVRLAYTGYEDEIIQLIELGNTSLSLPGSQLVSVSANAQGLFGAKMLAKTGSTDFTLIASKQEGEVSNAQFTPAGGQLGQKETVTIRDVDYIKNKYFYFDRPQAFVGVDGDLIVELYREVTGSEVQGVVAKWGWAGADPNGDGAGLVAMTQSLALNQTPTEAKEGQFVLLQKDIDYFYILDIDDNSVLGIELAEAIPNTALKMLAVRYTSNAGVPIGGTFADYGLPPSPDPTKGDMLVLEMLKAPEPDPDGVFPNTWPLMIRNIYSLGLSNIDSQSLDVTIEDIITSRLNPSRPDTSSVPYLKIFGLDQTDRAGTGAPDNRIDLTNGVVDLVRGILQFPTLTPFAPPPAAVAEWTDSRFSFDWTTDRQTQYARSLEIYNDRLNAVEEQEAHQYIIRVEAVSTSKTFRLNALDIVEGTEVITINGERLARGADYDIDYTTGEVTLKEGALAKLTPDARLNVDYQYKPLGGAGSSTLAGLSTATRIGENLRFGTTALYESRATSDERPRLGEEPTRAIVGGVTGSYQHESQILTDIANLLPYIDSDAPSTINLDGEIAASVPNPNTKNEAYVDDFEGVEDTDRIVMSRRSWYPASLPIVGVTPKLASERLDFIWYNIEPEFGVHRRDLNPELDEQENTLVQSLDIDLTSDPDLAAPEAFAGVMLGVPGGGLDLSQGQFIEIWVNDFKPNQIDRGGTIHIDLGLIDENFYRPEANTTEDEDRARDGFAATFDDTGLDGAFSDGRDNLPEPPGPNGTPDDPGGDDILLQRIDGRFTKANGTEANLLYDTEDLDRNGQMTRVNAYFSYTINLADEAAIDVRRQYPGYDGFNDRGHENDSWRMYRIKLTDFTPVTDGALQPRFDEVRHVRVWFDNVSDVVRNDTAAGRRRIQICEFSIEGNRWEADGMHTLADEDTTIAGSDFAIGVVSTKTDPGYYNPPIVPNQQNEVFDKESSLALRYTALEEGFGFRILKRFTGQGLDMTLYRDLNFWVHTDSLRDGVEYFFRLASSENVWYEVVVPFTSVYFNETGWSRVVVNLADLTNLKFEPPAPDVFGFAPDVGEGGRNYPVQMRGQPNLGGVRFLYAGVRNRSAGRTISGELWMNDIFTGSVMRDMDHAERFSANVSFAGGAFSIGGQWSRTGADYRGLRATRGSGFDNTQWGLNTKTDLQYFLPMGGFSVPLSANYAVSKALPKFPPNSDTEIEDPQVAYSQRTERITRGFSTSLSRRNTSNNAIMRYTMDRLRPTFQYSDQRGVSPSARDTTENMTGSLGYQLSWTGDKSVKLFGKNRMRWWLNQIDFTSTFSRTTGQRWSYVGGDFRRDPDQYNSQLRNSGSLRYEPFRSLDMSLSGFVLRDQALKQYWMGMQVGTEVGRGESLRLSFRAPNTWWGIRIFEPSFELQSNYNEDSGPNARKPGDPTGTRNASYSRDDTGKMRFEIGRHMGTVFKWFGWEPGTFGASGRGGAPPPVVTPSDTTGTVPDSAAVAVRKRGAGDLGRRVGQILVSLRPVSFNIRHRDDVRYLRIPGRPDLAFQLGADHVTGLVDTNGAAVRQPDSRNEQWSFDLDSGVQLSQSFDVQGRYGRSTTHNDFRLNRGRTVSVTWPDFQANWNGVGEFKPLRPVIANGTFTVNYRETHSESGQRDEPPITVDETRTFTPALTMTWKNELNSTLNVSWSDKLSETRGSSTNQDALTVTLDLRRNFRGGGGINFFGKKMKWNNELEALLTMSYSKTGGERSVAGVVASEPIPGISALRIAPTARYFFSRTVNGSAFIDYSRTFAEQTDQTTTVVRVGVSAVINF